MILSPEKLDSQTVAMIRAESLIRVAVLAGVTDQKRDAQIFAECEKIIKRAINAVKLPALRVACARSLREFTRRILAVMRREMRDKLYIYLATLKAKGKVKKPIRNEEGAPIIQTRQQAKAFVMESEEAVTYDTAPMYGVPAQVSPKELARRVKGVLDRIAGEIALDPDDASGRNSLRNRAEMEVRQKSTADRLDDLRAQGYKLVYIPPHADCSQRCREWQDRNYSLDNTSGRTDDGRSYIPIETAINVPYTTKAGKTYMNGLFGFGCRHYPIAWKKGMRYPRISKEETEKQREITEHQRYLERNVRHWKVIEIEAEAVRDNELERYAHGKAIEWEKRLVDWCRQNNRPIIPNRTEIL